VSRLREALARYLSADQKRALKSRVNQARKAFARSFLHYDGEALKARLRRAGISATDTVMVHSNFVPDSGFNGPPLALVDALVELLGERGNLLMVSIPFRGASYDYLALNKPFHVRKTISMMGLVTEMFRRREGTLRSLHPTHPVLACGKDARWLVAGHEHCLFPCGPGSPFAKLRELDGKILFFDVDFAAVTFFHYAEDLLKDRLPFPVYDERLFTVAGVDADGVSRSLSTYAFTKGLVRDTDKLQAELRRRGKIRKGRVGNSRFLWVTAEDVVSAFTAMVDAGDYPYDL
jgi:aminoglycoside 3-N-acetyltransferase